jgi:hypothetical protein
MPESARVRGAERRVSARAKRARAVACSRRSIEASAQHRVSARSRRSIEATSLPRRALSSTSDESGGAQQKRPRGSSTIAPYGVFSFQNVCDVLGIDGEALRARVRDSNPYTELSLKRILSPAPGKYHR